MNLFNLSSMLATRLRSRRGQGTVEYVGIVLAVGALLLALGAAFRSNKIHDPIVNSITDAIRTLINDIVKGKN